MDATLDQLRKKHPEYARWSPIWVDYRLAFQGGFEFLWAAGQSVQWRYDSSASVSGYAATPGPAFQTPRRRFLKQLEGEPNEVYTAVWDRAEYVNYLGGIINYFVSWLFSAVPIIQASEGNEKPDWWEILERDANGNRVGFFDFVKASFLDALLCRRSGWMIGRQASVADYGADDQVVLTPFRAEEILDWQCNEAGDLDWVVVGKCRHERVFPDDRRKIETITFINREEWATWEVVQDGDNERAEKIGEAVHGLGRVPFVMCEIPAGLWVTDKLFAWAMGLFNQWTRLRSAMLVGCIMQPFIRSNQKRESAQSRIIGDNVLLHLDAGREGEQPEDFGWKTPDTKPIEFIWSHFKEAVAEGYRIVHQMSMAVDAKSVASIARSGDSKVEDRKATEVILRGFGAIARQVEMQTLSLLSDIYGDKTTWTVDGYSDFSNAEPLDILQLLTIGTTFGIESTTYKKRIKRKVARIMLDGEDESTMGAIEKEIDDAEDEAEAMQEASMMGAPLGVPDEEEAGLTGAGEEPGDEAIDIDAASRELRNTKKNHYSRGVRVV